MKMWSGRFRHPLDPDFERWQRSFSFDRRLLDHELAASGAHALALKNTGILSADELISILQAEAGPVSAPDAPQPVAAAVEAEDEEAAVQ